MALTVPMIGTPQGWEWILIFLVIILLFGAAKLPDLARGTGRALRIFKAETKGLRDDEETDASDEESREPREPRGITTGESAQASGQTSAPAEDSAQESARHTRDS